MCEMPGSGKAGQGSRRGSRVEAEVEHVADFRKIAEYGVFSTPAVVVDGKVRSVGKIPKKEEILAWLIR